MIKPLAVIIISLETDKASDNNYDFYVVVLVTFSSLVEVGICQNSYPIPVSCNFLSLII